MLKNPFLNVTVSFGALILLGTLGLMVLPGLYTGAGLTWLDALFTATSAVCVTGLIVVDTATYFTTAGQVFILVLFQLGGMGIVTLALVIMSSLGLRMGLQHEQLIRNDANSSRHVDFPVLIRTVVLATLAIELVGAIVLYVLLVPVEGYSGAIWPAIFHAVSAFCNAGFSIYSDSLVGFADEPAILLVVSVLIILGGIGFLVLAELREWIRSLRKRRFVFSVHSTIVLVATAVLLVGGMALFLVFEWNVSFAEMDVPDRLANAFFLSVTARTAGFNTIDYNTAANNTDFLTILLMSIGGSPGSTAGGLKTTTAALIGLMAWSRIRGRHYILVKFRSIPDETVNRATGLFVVFFGIVTAGIFLFTSSEIGWAARTDNANFLPFMFEAVSALNTVGLSMGVTADLSSMGRIVTIALMFIGRVGPVTVALALVRASASHAHSFRESQEDIAIG